jgi:LPS-assembly protein
MKLMHKTFFIMGLSATTLASALTAQADPAYSYAKIVGWVNQANEMNICDGYYSELPIPYDPNPLIASQTGNYDIVADHTWYSLKGRTKLQGNVRVTQPTQQLNAGTAYLYRDPKTHKFSRVLAQDGVKLFQPGTLMAGSSAALDVKTKHLDLKNAVYRFSTQGGKYQSFLGDTRTPVNDQHGKTTEYRRYQLNYWGHAKTFQQNEPKVYTFKHGTYTTCPPNVKHCAWHISASTLRLNKKTQIGKAWNAVLYTKGVPIFYFPYMRFPLNHDRESGLMPPNLGHTDSSGEIFRLPFYWNIAPNYDALITPYYYTKRNYGIDTLLRYLTIGSAGSARFNFLPNDKAFEKFKRTAAEKYGAHTFANRVEGIHELNKTSDDRFGLHWNDNRQFSDHLSSEVRYNLVSDDNYIKDLGKSGLNIDNTDSQLLQKARLNYSAAFWNAGVLLQQYQSLHPVNMAAVPNQYARLPQFNFFILSPRRYHGLVFSAASTATHFYKTKDPDTGEGKPVIGDRVTLSPEVDLPLERGFGYFTPAIKAQITQYALSQLSNNNKSPGLAIPIFHIDSGLYFDRLFTFFGDQYKETLEPRLYYLYIPYHNQNQLPEFDTSVQTFSYASLFQDNSFSGADRLGDNNRLSYAVTTRFLNQDTGNQLGSASIGQAVYFADRRVMDCQGHHCSLPTAIDKRTFSPIAGNATYNFASNVTVNGDVTYDPYRRVLTNEGASLTYKPDARKIFNLDYNFIKSGGEIPRQTAESAIQTSRQLGLSSEYSIGQHWDLLGRYAYSWSDDENDHANAYLAGLEYDSCCWAVRLVFMRQFQGFAPNNKSLYNDAYYIEFDLRGLASFGNDDPSNTLSNISGFNNTFDEALTL